MLNELMSEKEIELTQVQDALLQDKCVHYRDWLIFSRTIHGKLWLRWQHPKDNFPRCGCPVGEKELSEVIEFVYFWINLAIELEENNS